MILSFIKLHIIGAQLSYEIKLHGHALGMWALDAFEASLSLNALHIIGLET